MEVEQLIDRYCDVWSEPEAGKRIAQLAEIWHTKATYTDPSVEAADSIQLLAHIAKVQAKRPGAKVVRTSQIDVHHGIARFAWHVVQANGVALPEGLDVAFVSADGNRIERIIGFFGPLNASEPDQSRRWPSAA